MWSADALLLETRTKIDALHASTRHRDASLYAGSSSGLRSAPCLAVKEKKVWFSKSVNGVRQVRVSSALLSAVTLVGFTCGVGD